MSQTVQLIDCEMLAATLNVKRKTIRNWVRAGRIPYYRNGQRIVRFNIEEVLESMRNNT